MKFTISLLLSALFLATVAHVLVKTEPAPVPPARMVRLAAASQSTATTLK